MVTLNWMPILEWHMTRLVVKIEHQSNVNFRHCQGFGGMYHLKPLAIDGVKSYVPYIMPSSNMVNVLFRIILSDM